MPDTSLADLLDSVYARLENNTAFYERATCVCAINEGIRVLNNFTGFTVGYVSVPSYTVANQAVYAMPATVLFPLSIWFEGKLLNKCELTTLSGLLPRWLKETTATEDAPVADWIPLGLTQFAIHPADAIGGRDLRVYGVLEPVKLVLDTDVIDIEDEFHEIIVEYASSTLPLMEAGKTFADAAESYLSFQKKMKSRMRWQKMKMPYFEIERTSK